jgi:hypothetical protein
MIVEESVRERDVGLSMGMSIERNMLSEYVGGSAGCCLDVLLRLISEVEIVADVREYVVEIF